MFWAIVNNSKVRPEPNTFGTCPSCGGKVHSKCGDVNEWHWAHYNGENCDSWYEPESNWHLDWKMTFGKENAEQVIRKNGKFHRADILTVNNVVIELQNSPIKIQTVKEREDFYCERMLWLINGIHFKDNFDILNRGDFDIYDRLYYKKIDKDIVPFSWKWARKSWEEVKRHVFIDFGKESLFWVTNGMGTSSGIGKYISKEKFINKYGGDYEYYHQQYQIRLKEIERQKKEIEREQNILINKEFLKIIRNRRNN